jgi:Alpha/beta hydrolase of unknown function (DUF900)
MSAENLANPQTRSARTSPLPQERCPLGGRNPRRWVAVVGVRLPQQQYEAVLTENQQLKAQLALSQQQYGAVLAPPPSAPPAPSKTVEQRAKEAVLGKVVTAPHLSPPPLELLEPDGERKRLIRVLFATNRKIDGPAVGTLGLQQITDNRSPSLAYGTNIIRVPEFHKIGELELPYDIRIFGLSIWKTAEREKQHFVLKHIERISKELYASSADKAMAVSRVKAGGVPRAGDVPADGPLVADGMDTIDVTAIGQDLFGLNHSVYSSNRALIDDIGRIFATSTRPPNTRSPQLRSVPEGSEHPSYWKYPE